MYWTNSFIGVLSASATASLCRSMLGSMLTIFLFCFGGLEVQPASFLKAPEIGTLPANKGQGKYILTYDLTQEESDSMPPSLHQLESSEHTYHFQPGVEKRAFDAYFYCVALNRIVKGWDYRHEVQEVECLRPYETPFYRVTCRVYRKLVVALPFEPWSYQGITKTSGQCRRNHICTPLNFMTPVIGGVMMDRDISCVPWSTERNMRAMHANYGHEHVPQEQTGCSNVEEVPGRHDGGSSSTAQTFVITAEAQFPNGSEYKAPTMYIRDLSKMSKAFDRALKHDTAVVSTRVVAGTYRGQLQSQKMQICLDLTAAAGQWVVLHYTWYRAQARHSPIPTSSNTILELL